MGRVGNEPGPHRFRHTYATDLFRRGVHQMSFAPVPPGQHLVFGAVSNAARAAGERASPSSKSTAMTLQNCARTYSDSA
jgi:hypothetical protein